VRWRPVVRRDRSLSDGLRHWLCGQSSCRRGIGVAVKLGGAGRGREQSCQRANEIPARKGRDPGRDGHADRALAPRAGRVAVEPDFFGCFREFALHGCTPCLTVSTSWRIPAMVSSGSGGVACLTCVRPARTKRTPATTGAVRARGSPLSLGQLVEQRGESGRAEQPGAEPHPCPLVAQFGDREPEFVADQPFHLFREVGDKLTDRTFGRNSATPVSPTWPCSRSAATGRTSSWSQPGTCAARQRYLEWGVPVCDTDWNE
jgi:hypothetical protein